MHLHAISYPFGNSIAILYQEQEVRVARSNRPSALLILLCVCVSISLARPVGTTAGHRVADHVSKCQQDIVVCPSHVSLAVPTLPKAARPLGTSANLISLAGLRAGKNDRSEIHV